LQLLHLQQLQQQQQQQQQQNQQQLQFRTIISCDHYVEVGVCAV
jgi:hypothetical protein